jgi:hypothetical protein
VQLTIDTTALAGVVTFLGVTGGAVVWAFRRVNDVAKTARMTRLIARALRIPDDSPDEEVVEIIREAFTAGRVDDTGEHEVIRPGSGRLPTGAPRRPALRPPLRREED